MKKVPATIEGIQKARERLALLLQEAVNTFEKVMRDPEATNLERIRAAENVLDRCGIPKMAHVSMPDVAEGIVSLRQVMDELAEARRQDPNLGRVEASWVEPGGAGTSSASH